MSDTNANKISMNVIILCVTLAFMACLGAFVYLSINNIDTAQFVAFLAFAVGAIPGTAAWKNSRDVKEQTNGPLTSRLDAFDERLSGQDNVLSSQNDVLTKQNESLRKIMDHLGLPNA